MLFYSNNILTAFIFCRSFKYISLGQMNQLIKMSGTELWMMSLLHTFHTSTAYLRNIHTEINFFTSFTEEIN